MMTNETHVTGEPKLSARRLSTSLSNKTIRAAKKLLLERKLLAVGARIVLVTETLVENHRVNSVQARTLEKA
jgi:hypothetical protein